MATLAEDQAAIQRRQKMAEMLMSQGAEPLETNQTAGGFVVPVSPLAGVAKIAQQLSGTYLAKQAEKSQSDLNDKKSGIVQALFSGNTQPGLSDIAASGLASPSELMTMGNAQRVAEISHNDKLDEKKLSADLAAQQRESDQKFRAEQAQIARDQSFAQQQQMAQLAASLRPAPQSHQDALVQVMGENGQPVYMPSSQAVGKQPFNAQSLKQEQADTTKSQQKTQAELSAQQALDQTAILNAHPGRAAATGASSFMSKIPGTEAKGFQANLDTFKAQTFLPLVSTLKGMGALSDAEGKKISDSVGALDPSMPEAEFEQSLKNVSKFLYDKAKSSGLNVQLPEFAADQQQAPMGGGDIVAKAKAELERRKLGGK